MARTRRRETIQPEAKADVPQSQPDTQTEQLTEQDMQSRIEAMERTLQEERKRTASAEDQRKHAEDSINSLTEDNDKLKACINELTDKLKAYTANSVGGNTSGDSKAEDVSEGDKGEGAQGCHYITYNEPPEENLSAETSLTSLLIGNNKLTSETFNALLHLGTGLDNMLKNADAINTNEVSRIPSAHWYLILTAYRKFVYSLKCNESES